MQSGLLLPPPPPPTTYTLAQIGLGSPDLYSSTPLHLQERILDLMSELFHLLTYVAMKRKMAMVQGTLLPFIQFLYTESITSTSQITKERSEDFRHNQLHISCCNVLLYGLANAFGRELHLEILVKEGLLDYTMCLPAVLPVECQPRARSLVNELGKHRQLQPPSLCTLAKAHIAKTKYSVDSPTCHGDELENLFPSHDFPNKCVS